MFLLGISFYFNSRPLYRGRLTTLWLCKMVIIFQLTPPIQRATWGREYLQRHLYISTHAPYTEGDYIGDAVDLTEDISTHAPYTEGDVNWKIPILSKDGFQLTPPIQRATFAPSSSPPKSCISTHAPYTEGDLAPPYVNTKPQYFNSRPLYRGRPRWP